MYSKEESKRLRIEFWNTFGYLSKKKRQNRAWLLYNTKIKDVNLKFTAEQKFCAVSIDIEYKNTEKRHNFYNNLLSLQKLFNEEFNNELIWAEDYTLPNGKVISRIFVEKTGLSIYNKKNWTEIFEFLYTNMNKMENMFLEYKDIIKEFVEQ